MILVSYSSIIWYLGFSPEDRMLFKRQKMPDLAEPVMKADEEEA